ncbi:MAG: 4Fe-4S ferredoxin [Firmicutes bacterium]|nr:4Fe-4S ferredoxin [Bacillota bacterium]
MKTALYYFTGTGNSLAVTRDLAIELQDNVEIIPITRIIQAGPVYSNHDVVGIIFPAWLHHIPPVVEEFMAKIIVNDSYIFAICTYAINPYNSLFDINAALEQKGSKLTAGFAIAMGGKYVLLKDITFSDEENERRFAEEKKKIKVIANIIKEKQQFGIEGSFDTNETRQLVYYHKHIYKVHEKFRVTEACTLCGQCIKICPKNNIKIINANVLWKENCDYCLACLHWCPKTAIQNGELSPTCRRYHHPSISITDIILR